MKKFVIILFMALILTGCVTETDTEGKQRDLEFTVVKKEEIPEELRKDIEERQKDTFQITYTDGNFLYIAEGYGIQPTSGYSVSVTEVYETENAICIHTNLIGPGSGEEVKKTESFPYVAVKVEYSEKQVVFK